MAASATNKAGMLSAEALHSKVTFALAFLALAYYLLPSTVWGQMSPANALASLSQSTGTHIRELRLLLLLGIVALAGCAAFLFVTCWRAAARPMRPIRLLALTALYLSPYFVNVLFCPDSSRMLESCSLIDAVLTGMLVSICLWRGLRNIGVLLCLLGGIQAIYAFQLHRMGANAIKLGDSLQAGGTFHQPQGLYVLMLVALPLSVEQITHGFQSEASAAEPSSSDMLRSVLWMLCVTLTSAALLLASYPASLVGIAVSIIWLLFRRLPDRRVAAVFSLCLAVAVLVRVVPDARNPSASLTASGKRAYRLFQQNPAAVEPAQAR